MSSPEPQTSCTIVVPTFRERENIPIVVERLEKLLAGWDWEVVFVDDDSNDGSAEVLLELCRTKPHVRMIRRIGRRGLASACLEGMGSSAAELFAVMDADLQHDETILPQMLAAAAADPALDLVVGTRYAGDGGVGTWSKSRHALSRLATQFEKAILRTSLSDPMSGFFVIRREVYEETVRRMTGKGFKILLDIFLSASRPLKIREFSYQFRTRQHGESKLDVVVGLEYLYLLVDKSIGWLLPVRFLMYVLAGFSGLAVHLAVLATVYLGLGTTFAAGQTAGTVLAIVSNFFVNNAITFRSSKLKGGLFIPGLIAYLLICGVGAVVNVQTAEYLFESQVPWWMAGVLGALIGAVWNYAVSSHVVWTWLPRAIRQRKSAQK